MVAAVVVCSFNSFSVIESNKTIIENVKKNVQRLAQPLKKPHLYPQVVVVGMIEFASNAEMKRFRCTVHETWMNAVLQHRQATGGRDAVPDLLFVVKRLQTYVVPCTSKIEQTVCLLVDNNKVFTNHRRLNMSPAMENMAVPLLVNRNIGGDADLFENWESTAQMWSHAYMEPAPEPGSILCPGLTAIISIQGQTPAPVMTPGEPGH